MIERLMWACLVWAIGLFIVNPFLESKPMRNAAVGLAALATLLFVAQGAG